MTILHENSEITFQFFSYDKKYRILSYFHSNLLLINFYLNNLNVHLLVYQLYTLVFLLWETKTIFHLSVLLYFPENS